MENGNLEGGGASAPSPFKNETRSIPLWVQTIPFFMSALLFMSAFFSVFSPLPLILLWLSRRRAFTWAAILTNSALVFAAAGLMSLVTYWIFVISVVIALGIGFSRCWKLEKSAVVALSSILVTALAIVLVYSAVKHLPPWLAIRQELLALQEVMRQTITYGPKDLQTSLLNGVSVDEWLEGVALELPSAVGVFSLVLVSINVVIVFRMNPQGLRAKLGLDSAYLKRWKAPDWLVWPTLALGFLVIFTRGAASTVSLGLFKCVATVYVLQGLSILGFFLDIWKIQGVFRALALVVAVFLMLPLILSLGFFDLWFDFRAKFRQT